MPSQKDSSPKIPKLRFQEFQGEWNIKELWKIADKVTKKNRDESIKYVLSNSAVEWIVSQESYFDRDIANQNNLGNYYVVNTDDFVYNPRISLSAPVGPIKRNHLSQGVMSPLYSVFRFHTWNLDFFEFYFETNYWHKYLESIANFWARHDRMNITTDGFYNIPIPFPSIPEQANIASFLTVVDKKIEKLKTKKSFLEQYKKWVMQKIFAREIRFKDENGEEYGEWEEKTLGDVGEFRTSSIDKKTVAWEKEVYLVNYMNVYRHEEITNTSKNNLTVVTARDSQIESSNLRRWDILFTPSSETPDDIWHSVVIFEDLDDTVYSYHVMRFRPKIEIDLLYSHYFCNIPSVLKQLTKFATGSTRFTISVDNFSKIVISLPKKNEQQKIASFLSEIDKKIQVMITEIESVEKWKKGLLQSMFV